MIGTVGLIPAAGLASRLGRLPCSKEVYPIGFSAGGSGPSVAIEHLLAEFHRGSARRAFIVLRKGKWDIPGYLSDGNRLGMHLAYLMMRIPLGQAYSVDAAYPSVRNSIVLFGSPDVLFDADDAFARLLDQQFRSRAEVVLGVFPARCPERVDMVELDAKGRVLHIAIKPVETSLTYTWIIAVWTPAFTEVLHMNMASRIKGAEQVGEGQVGSEVYVGDVLQAAIDEGMTVDSVTFGGSSYIDLGTAGDLAELVNRGFPGQRGVDRVGQR